MSQNSLNVSLPLSTSQGGTGTSSFTKGQILTGNASGGLTALNAPTDGQCLVADSTQTGGYRGQAFSAGVAPGLVSTGPVKWQNTRQVSVANYAVTDDTNSISLSGPNSTTLDVGQLGSAGGQMVSANLAGTVQVNRNQISGTGTSFATTFQVGDIINLPSYYQSRKITTINSNTEMLTDGGDFFEYSEWSAANGSPSLSTAQAKFGSSSLSLPASSSLNQSFYGSTNGIHQYEFTLESNFYLSSIGTSAATVLMGGQLANQWGVNLNTNGTLALNISSAGSSFDVANGLNGTTVLAANQWYHIAFTFYLSTYTVWLNGRAEIALNSSTPPVSTFLNQFAFGPSASGTALFVDEARISSCCRYTSAFTPPSAAFSIDAFTLSLNHFEGPAGSIDFNTNEVMRPSPVRWDNTYYNTATLSSAQVKFGSTSMYNSGTCSVALNTGQSLKVDPTNYCVEFWLYPTAVTTASSVLDSLIAGYTFNINLTSASKIALNIGTNGTSANVASGTSTQTLANNTWAHIALSYDGATYRVFINGALGISVASTTQPTAGWSRCMALGSANNKASGTAGYYDVFRFSNIARYTAAFTAPTATFTVDANTISLNQFEGPANSVFIQDGEQIGGTSYARGGLARNTFYYPYAVGNSSSSQLMLSPRCKSYGDTLIDLPSGMTFVKQLKFAILVNTRGNVPRFVFSGNMINYTFVDDGASATFGFSSDYMLLSGGKALSFSTIATSTLVPKISALGFFASYMYNDSSAQITTKVRSTGDNSYLNGQTVGIVSSTTNSAYNMGNYNDTFIGLNSQQQFDYKLSSAGGNANCGFLVKGYRITEV